MKTKQWISTLLFLSLSSLALAENVYLCPLNNGKSEYTSTYRAGCVDPKLKKIEGYQPAVTGSSPSTETASVAAPAAEPQSANNTESELAAAERALAEGKAVRYGSERNYAKYQERIQKLEEDVAHARAKLQQAPDNDNAR